MLDFKDIQTGKTKEKIELEQLKQDKTDLEKQLAQTNADFQGLTDYLVESGVI
jgi:cell division protein FtsB